MREIKFRIWDIHHKWIVPPDSYSVGCSDGKARNIECIGTIGGFVLMQYTGLKDKQGKDIYEGDIIIVKRLTDFTPYGYWVQPRGPAIPNVIEWNDDYCSFNVPNPSYHFEVIGNIYENPELLESEGE